MDFLRISRATVESAHILDLELGLTVGETMVLAWCFSLEYPDAVAGILFTPERSKIIVEPLDDFPEKL